MTKEEVIGKVALRDLKKRERLMQIIQQPGYQYYMGGNVLRLVFALAFVTYLTWFRMLENVPGWGFLISIVALCGFLEATRQRGRFNAFIELHELEANEANKSSLPTGMNPTTSTSTALP